MEHRQNGASAVVHRLDIVAVGITQEDLSTIASRSDFALLV
jgi:hypothetical protein